MSFNNPALGLIDSVGRHVRGYMVFSLGRFTQYGLGGTTSCGTALGLDDSSGGAGTTFGGTWYPGMVPGAMAGGKQQFGRKFAAGLAIAPDCNLVSVLPVRGHLV